jgi:hypothetical protein
MLTAFVPALVVAPAADVAVITPEQAKDHVGEEVVVQGQVTQIGDSELFHTGPQWTRVCCARNSTGAAWMVRRV